MNPNNIKEKYLSFFESKNHARIPSASLIPENDPTVLFTTAGMQPLVPFLMGQPHPNGKRLTDVQKCIRTGDIDDVGDATHLTFFEMLGNWSLGDYFKKESLAWSWEFLTDEKWLGLDKKRIAVTVFEGDDDAPRDEEAADIWKSLGMPAERIAYLGKEDNWWGPAGQTGPCGPDSEIFYWKPNDRPAPEVYDPSDDNWVEIWNNVFMQYEKIVDGSLVPLKQQNVDTGMGYERLIMTLLGKDSVYDTFLFEPLFTKISQVSVKKYDDYQQSFRIIADHIKTATMILGDERAVTPSNVDQGYVLRKLIRRAIRHGLLLGIEENFTAKIAEVIIPMYETYYPSMTEKSQFVLDELTKEEQKFRQTLEKGLKLIQKKVAGIVVKSVGFEKLKEEGLLGKDDLLSQKAVSFGITKLIIEAKWLFDLFQSHGMPPELSIEELSNYGLELPNKYEALKEFDTLFAEHQAKSRAGAEQKFKGGLADDSEQTTRLHTATHLLNEALRKVIDANIVQKGSNITAQRLRFDFNFDRKLTPEEIKAVEDEVNRVIQEGHTIEKYHTTPEQAKAQGAQSEFGARYPEKVSVYKIGDYSLEICMGPHVENTKDIGTFKIKKEESSAAGIRRIKAVVE